MLSENEPKSAKVENEPALILSVIFIAIILVTICASRVLWLNKLKEPRPNTAARYKGNLNTDGSDTDRSVS